MRCSLISLLFACSSSSGPHLGGPCPCDDGAICDMTDPGGPVCISSTGDLDGDGIPNGMDFCEHMPGGMYDEDNDGIGDECDPCPIAPPPATPDPDGDAVDSPCDPDPQTPGDKIILFDGFHDLAATWKATTPAAWMIEGGEVVATLDTIGSEDYLKMPVQAEPNFAVEASYRVDKLETSASTHVISVSATDPRPAGVASFECGVAQADSSSSGVVDLQTNEGTTSTPTARGFQTQSLYKVGAYATRGNVGCTVIGDGTPLGATQLSITPDALATVALGARAVTARFQWVLVVGRD